MTSNGLRRPPVRLVGGVILASRPRPSPRPPAAGRVEGSFTHSPQTDVRRLRQRAEQFTAGPHRKEHDLA
jgi:hypothetical protein